ncbi:MAG: tryptophan synthase subunit alpha [Melioribacter sp.]|nr:tryptophan synthase subunit alpha [Melioribacter sp.]
MSFIKNYIEGINNNARKVLSIFLTAGFPNKNNFVDLAKRVFDSGADMIELGIPFSDPLADGPIIQASSKIALDNGIKLKDVFSFSEAITSGTDKPVILMGYANPIRKYGIENFFRDANSCGVKGLIIPDVPLEEYDFFFESSTHSIDVILLTTPASSKERIKAIDEKSSGFVYCVSITGTTGVKENFSDEVISNISRTRSLIKKNKMLIGFGVSKPEDVKTFSPYCDGVIVGSAVIKSLLNNDNYDTTLRLISQLSQACE